MKKCILITCCLSLTLVSTANAAPLQIIGSATYGGYAYNLIWEKDNNGQSLIWFDYVDTHGGDGASWYDQTAWADALTFSDMTILPDYRVAWTEGVWRLPATVDEDASTGYDKTNSEMGHLYYISLGNTAGTDTPMDTGVFNNLLPFGGGNVFWSGTEYSAFNAGAWYFNMNAGYQNWPQYKTTHFLAIAVRSAEVTVVPLPATALLYGPSLLGIMGIKRKRRK